MSTLHDLRSTLEQHADGLDDSERYVRPVAVRARIRAARRRRTALAATAAVLVVVAGVAAAGTLRGPGEIAPADRVVAGVDVPGRIDVVGFPYRLTDLTDLTDGKVDLDEADHDQAVVLAASGLGTGSATLYADGKPVARVRGGEQVAAPYPLDDTAPHLRVRFDGAGAGARAGVAVYEATGAVAPGVDNGDVVFRDEYAGEPLLGAAFAEPGESSVDFESRGAEAMRFVLYCDGPEDLMVNVDIDGAPGVSFGCGDRGPDAAAGTSAVLDEMGLGTHDLHVYLTRGSDETPVDVDGVTVGGGVYPAGGAVEYAGRTWVPTETFRPGGGSVSVDTADGDRLLGASGRGELGLTWSGDLADGGSDGFIGGRGPGSMLAGVLLAGDRYRVDATGPDARVLVYRPE